MNNLGTESNPALTPVLKTGTPSPQWWADKHTSSWERAKDALRRDWEQTKADFSKTSGRDLNQGVSDTVKQAAGKEPLPPRDVPNPSVPTARKWEGNEDAVRYGYGAGMHYGDYSAWDDRTEGALRKEWNDLKEGHTWDEIKDAVRHGWQKARALARGRGR